MAWSTRELAELAGTTVKTVRHYHRIGLLDEPERRPNGYKRYGVAHLVRLLRIRRLADLGVPLSDIPAMEDPRNAEETLRALDSELKASIERQQRMREEVRLILSGRSLPDLPPGFDGDVAGMSELQRSWLMIYSQVLDEHAIAALMRPAEPFPPQTEFEALPADADDATRQRLAETFAPLVRRQFAENPDLAGVASSEALATPVVLHALVELYNPAQLDVLRRLNEMLGL
ncbi:MerR family transcriptional regulator [Saccharopolyspora flava]|uniref:DNA-binding transcriptional regulator, MerR family n=1 Tax=Saccharopolyspora flava TaxID=95161 RepID=A0A1I6QT02_9PSEU|nr:MerR family transcriptional regulator [Saccharopolyspora flava]SFS55549.1 DNA-binding transcriptional regulator, MerR family [Saccharopolyspora flava]